MNTSKTFVTENRPSTVFRTAPASILICTVVAGLAGCSLSGADAKSVSARQRLADEVVSLNIGEPEWVLTKHGLLDPRMRPIALPEADQSHRLTSAWVDKGGRSLTLGFENGNIYRSANAGETWDPAMRGFDVPDFEIIDVSLRHPIPRQFVRADDGTLYVATIGRGVLRYDEDGAKWVDATFNLAQIGALHPLAWSVGRSGRGVVAGFASPRGLIPAEASLFFGAAIRRIASPGAEPQPLDTDMDVRLPVDLAELDGQTLVATLGQGLWQVDADDDWSQIGPEPLLSDLWAIDADGEGNIAAITRSGDVWYRYGHSSWTRVRCAEDGGAGIDVRIVEPTRLQIAAGNSLERFVPRSRECAQRGGAKIKLAISHHVNLYHSYRGNSDGEDGYGKDIRVIDTTLDIADRHPSFHLDWDIENQFSLDGWLTTDEQGQKIRQRIAQRVRDGIDGLRLMSANNGMVGAETEAEFKASIDLARQSYEAYVPGAWVPGVQPQENMYTPAHLDLYRKAGVDWMTLFNSATPFTGFRQEVRLDLPRAHSVLTLRSALSDATMGLIPVYHHADILDHGGLANWLRQLHDTLDGVAVLAIHFDADSESWLGFETELRDVEDMNADWVEPARLQDIVRDVTPGGELTIQRDLADGAFDGYSAWTEKPVNHRFFTRVVRARQYESYTRALVASPDAEIVSHLEAAAAARLRTLSTTHFGLATPFLHSDREADGDAVSSTAEQQAAAALGLAISAQSLSGATVYNFSATDVTFVQPVTRDAQVFGDGLQPSIRSVSSGDGLRHWIVGRVPAGPTPVTLRQSDIGLAIPPVTQWGPSLGKAKLLPPSIVASGTPITAEGAWRTTSGSGGDLALTYQGAWKGSDEPIRFDWVRVAEDEDAWWVEASLRYPLLGDAPGDTWEEVIPLPIELPAARSWVVTRRLRTGEAAAYTVSEPADAVNNHAADGWVLLRPEGAATGFSLTVYESMRAAPAFVPIRFRQTAAGLVPLLAPFGSLWGEQVDHQPSLTMAAGLGQFVSLLLAAHVKPSAPAWAGQPLCFLMRIEAETRLDDLRHLDRARDGVLYVGTDKAPRVGRPGCP